MGLSSAAGPRTEIGGAGGRIMDDCLAKGKTARVPGQATARRGETVRCREREREREGERG